MSLESAVAYLRDTGASCSVSLVGASPLPIWVLMARRSLGPRSRLAIVGMTADTGFGRNDTAVSGGALTHVTASPPSPLSSRTVISLVLKLLPAD